jgi:hypothetical protein
MIINRQENFKLLRYSRKRTYATLISFLKFRVSSNALKILFLLVLVYVVAITFVLILQEAATWLRDIVSYSVMGFVTFFMGWFGWELAKDIRNIAFGERESKK